MNKLDNIPVTRNGVELVFVPQLESNGEYLFYLAKYHTRKEILQWAGEKFRKQYESMAIVR